MKILELMTDIRIQALKDLNTYKVDILGILLWHKVLHYYEVQIQIS